MATTPLAAPTTRASRRRATLRSLVAFGGVGALAFVVDVGVYNLLRATVLEGSPIWSKVASVTVATAVAWLGNRTLAFRDRRGGPVAREALLFAATNVVGLLVSAACLFVSHYLLGLTSQLADNVAGNVVGVGLGTAVRYVGYRAVVFRGGPIGTNPTNNPSGHETAPNSR
jgi:putative flippase GtrA